MDTEQIITSPPSVVDQSIGTQCQTTVPFDLNEYFRKHMDRSRQDFRSCPHIVCADGLTLSVQASRYHYCTPRDSDGPWYKVEVGFPSAECPELMEWAESPESPTQTVYGYVPVEVVERLIDSHGGIKP